MLVCFEFHLSCILDRNFKKFFRSLQDSNLRGETPLDFKSNALTTRPRLPCSSGNQVDNCLNFDL